MNYASMIWMPQESMISIVGFTKWWVWWSKSNSVGWLSGNLFCIVVGCWICWLLFCIVVGWLSGRSVWFDNDEFSRSTAKQESLLFNHPMQYSYGTYGATIPWALGDCQLCRVKASHFPDMIHAPLRTCCLTRASTWWDSDGWINHGYIVNDSHMVYQPWLYLDITWVI